MPLPRIVVVPPTFAEIAELARTLAPSGFELVIVRNEHTELEAALATAEYLVCYPNVRTGEAFYRARAQAASAPAAQRRLRRRRSRGCAPRQGAGFQQR